MRVRDRRRTAGRRRVEESEFCASCRRPLLGEEITALEVVEREVLNQLSAGLDRPGALGVILLLVRRLRGSP